LPPRNSNREYKDHLEVFFEYIFNNRDINEKYYPITGYAKSIYNKLKNYRDDANWSLSIEPPWIIPIEGDENFRNRSAYLLISGKVGVKNSEFTFYSFSLCIVIDNRIARRFHFDVATGSSKIPKPKCHMQYGGKAFEVSSLPHLNYDLDPWIEKPRFPFPPLDFILLLDLIFRQFGTSIGHKFVEERFWKKLVKDSERLRLNDYYYQIHHYFNNLKAEKRTLFEKLCY